MVGVLQGVVSGFAGSRLIDISAGLMGNFRLFKHIFLNVSVISEVDINLEFYFFFLCSDVEVKLCLETRHSELK